MAQKPKRSDSAEPKKRGRDWGFLLFIAGILLIAVGTQVPILIPIGIAFIVVVIVGILVRMFKQLYF
jgi:membrane-bound ClpP family serine protease